LSEKCESRVPSAVPTRQTGLMGWEPLHRPSGPWPLEKGLDQLASELKSPRAQVLKTVFETWTELVGAVLAAHSCPARLVDGELIVTVDDPAWATEMRFFSGQLIERINATVTEEVVTSLKVKVRSR